jgi:hypothetical protein
MTASKARPLRVCRPSPVDRSLDAVDVLAGQPTIERRDVVPAGERVLHDRAPDERCAAHDQ